MEYWGKEENNGRHKLKMSNVKFYPPSAAPQATTDQMPNQILMLNDKKEQVIELLDLGF